MSIGENIRKIRIEKGLTQKQVADSCGVIDSTIRTYERGKANPKPATVAKIAKALNVSVAELYGVDWMPGIETPDQEANSALYQSFLLGENDVLPIDEPIKARLLVAFGKLNKDGQMEAIKRIEEMTLIPAYQGLLTTPDSLVVGEKIRKLRREKGLSYQDLGRLCDLPELELRRIELGFIPEGCLARISGALEVPDYELLNLTEKERKLVMQPQAIKDVYENLGYEIGDEKYLEMQATSEKKKAEIIAAATARLYPPEE